MVESFEALEERISLQNERAREARESPEAYDIRIAHVRAEREDRLRRRRECMAVADDTMAKMCKLINDMAPVDPTPVDP